MLKRLDLLLVLAVFVLTGLHLALATPPLIAGGTMDDIWFFGTGLAMGFCGLLNMLRARRARPPFDLWASALLSALLMFGVVIYFGVTQDAFLVPVIIAQVIAYGGLILIALKRTP
jgi:peptidoglycan/LPS O-acetylase OafA/YrhL